MSTMYHPEASASAPWFNRFHAHYWELVRFKFGAAEQTSALHFCDDMWEFLLESAELFHKFNAALTDIVA
jgi:hypothetical protein